MRCQYCGGFNSDRAAYCVYCGRDLRAQLPNQPVSNQQPHQHPAPQGRPAAIPQPQPSGPVVSPGPTAPEPPALFPPRTVAQLQALEQGALAYNVVDSTTGVGRKKIVRIVYPKAVPWQQVATLFKALKDQQEDRFDTVIIQGVLEQDTPLYAFTNGQLVFDRNVLLGGNTTKRYQVETGNGFEIDSIRIVLTG
jgi:hypothetical protein